MLVRYGVALILFPAFLAQAQKTTPDIYRDANPAVVEIEGEQKSGSGFMISSDGIVVTNYHVVAGEKTVSVRLTNGLELTTDEVLAEDQQLDIVILHINGKGFPKLRIGDSARVSPGDSVVVIGNPRPKGRVATTLDRLGLNDIVSTISGVSDEELARLYGEAEVAIVPSLYEGFSLPAIEAMSCGVPVVATTGGALPEVVGVSEETGLLVEPNNPDALVGAIRRLLDDAELRERLGAAGRERVMERFTWEVTARGTAACYDAILRGEALPESMKFD